MNMKTRQALRTQYDAAIGKDHSAAYGIKIATLAIIQAEQMDFAKARKILDYIGIYSKDDELLTWIRPAVPTIKEALRFA